MSICKECESCEQEFLGSELCLVCWEHENTKELYQERKMTTEEYDEYLELEELPPRPRRKITIEKLEGIS